MLWSVNGTAKCIPVILFLPVYFFLISSWLGQDFYIITRPKSYFPYLPYLPLWAYFPGRNIPANSTGKYRGWNLPLNLVKYPPYLFHCKIKLNWTHDGQPANGTRYSPVICQTQFDCNWTKRWWKSHPKRHFLKETVKWLRVQKNHYTLISKTAESDKIWAQQAIDFFFFRKLYAVMNYTVHHIIYFTKIASFWEFAMHCVFLHKCKICLAFVNDQICKQYKGVFSDQF